MLLFELRPAPYVIEFNIKEEGYLQVLCPKQRRKTPTVNVGGVRIGSAHPVVIQSMTDTPTAEIRKSIRQVRELFDAGSELVRLTVNNEEAARAIPLIASEIKKTGRHVPLIGDFHYNGHYLLKKYPQCAQVLAKWRINPGNVGQADHFRNIIGLAVKYRKPIRIGVNSGSLDKKLYERFLNQNSKKKSPQNPKNIFVQAAVESALRSARKALALGLKRNQLILSVKLSGVQETIEAYRQLARKCDHVLHVGLTESGSGEEGIISSTAALSILLQEGIGDTIRMSLTPKPRASRSLEAHSCQILLQSLGLRYFYPRVISCPGCGRTARDGYKKLAESIKQDIQKNMPVWKKKYPGIEQITIAVMGCVVNGPGESRHATIGISLPGKSEKSSVPVFLKGERVAILRNKKSLKRNFLNILKDYLEKELKKKRPL